jgi:hypothetical protein
MGNNPSHFGNKPRHPVEQVSWDEVQQFLKTRVPFTFTS